jgi:hypothetical protein
MDLGCNGALPSFPYARLVPADIPICVYFRHGKIMHNDDFAIIENGHEGTYICSFYHSPGADVPGRHRKESVSGDVESLRLSRTAPPQTEVTLD